MPNITSGVTNNLVVTSQTYYVYSSGQVNIATLNNSGILDLYFGGKGHNVIVKSGGTAKVSSGGMVTSATVYRGGLMQVYNSVNTFVFYK